MEREAAAPEGAEADASSSTSTSSVWTSAQFNVLLHVSPPVLDPRHSTLLTVFRPLLLASIVFGSFFIPFTISFSKNPGWSPYDDAEAILYYILTAVWTADILVNVNTGYYDREKLTTSHEHEGDEVREMAHTKDADHHGRTAFGDVKDARLAEEKEKADDDMAEEDDAIGVVSFGTRRVLVTNRRAIAYRYIFSVDAIMDVISVLPIAEIAEWISGNNVSDTLKRYLLLFRLLRLFQVRKFLAFVRRIEADIRFPQTPITIAKYIFLILALGNLAACIFYFIARVGYDEDKGVKLGLSGSGPNLTIAEQYILSLYWSIVTLTTVGYGDMSPRSSTPEQIFAVVYMLINLVVLSYTIAAVTLLVVKGGGKARHHAEVQVDARRLASLLPTDVGDEVKRCMDATGGKGGAADMDVLTYFPRSICDSVSWSLYANLLERALLFSGCSGRCVQVLLRGMRFAHYPPYSSVVMRGETAEYIFVILKGTAGIEDDGGSGDDYRKEDNTPDDADITKGVHGREEDPLGAESAYKDSSTGGEYEQQQEYHGEVEMGTMALNSSTADDDGRHSGDPLAHYMRSDQGGSLLSSSAAASFFLRRPCTVSVLTSEPTTLGLINRALWKEVSATFPRDARRILANMKLSILQSDDGDLWNLAVRVAREHVSQLSFHALRAAVERDDVPRCVQLASRGAARVACSALDGRTIFHIAAMNESVSTMKWLFEERVFDTTLMNALDMEGHTPLGLAICAGSDRCATVLVSNGAIMARDEGTALLFETVDACDMKRAARLLRLGCVNPLRAETAVDMLHFYRTSTTSASGSPLVHAAALGHFGLARQLANAAVRARDDVSSSSDSLASVLADVKLALPRGIERRKIDLLKTYCEIDRDRIHQVDVDDMVSE